MPQQKQRPTASSRQRKAAQPKRKSPRKSKKKTASTSNNNNSTTTSDKKYNRKHPRRIIDEEKDEFTNPKGRVIAARDLATNRQRLGGSKPAIMGFHIDSNTNEPSMYVLLNGNDKDGNPIDHTKYIKIPESEINPRMLHLRVCQFC